MKVIGLEGNVYLTSLSRILVPWLHYAASPHEYVFLCRGAIAGSKKAAAQFMFS
jgi:hypothetical protein